MSLTAIFYLLLYFGLIFRSLAGNPLYGLYAYIMTIYMYAPGSWWGGSLPDLRWSLLSALVTLISILLHTQKRQAELRALGKALYEGAWYSSTPIKLFAIFVVWVWIQKGWAMNAEIHHEYAVMVTKFLLLFFLVNKTILTKEDFVNVLIAHLLGCSFFGYLGLSHSSGRFESAPTPGMSDGNLLSIHMSPFLIAGGFLLLISDWRRNAVLVVALVLTLNAIFLTQSRGGMLGLAVSAAVALFFVPRSKAKVFFGLAALAVLGASFLVGDQVLERLKTTQSNPDTGQMEASAESRIYIAKAQLEMIADNPIVGYGHYGTLFLSPLYIEDRWLTAVGDTQARGSHNLTMSILVDHGIVGGVFYFAMIIWLLFQWLKLRSYIRNSPGDLPIIALGCFLGLLNVLVTSQFANSVRLEVVVWVVALCDLVLRFVNLELAESLMKQKSKQSRARTK